MEKLGEYLGSPFVERALIASVLIALNAGVAGAFAMFRNSTFVISGAGHAALAGAAAIILLHTINLALNVDPMIGGGITAVMLSVLAAYASYHGRTGETDTKIGVGFAFSMAVALLLVSLVPESAAKVWSILVGDILLITWSDLVILLIETLIVTSLFMLFHREFMFITFDIEGAKAFGINAGAFNLLMFALIGLSVAALLKGIGAILVFAMMVAPAATAMQLSSSVRGVIIGGALIALISILAAILISFYVKFSVSALAAFLASATYFIVAAILNYSEKRVGVPGRA
jgi:zinc/manganese transport system permease protein/zinc transport system permease protein/iron/zinc/copper transport system permease protein